MIQSFLDRLRARYLRDATTSFFCGNRVSDMSRDELMAVVIWYGDREIEVQRALTERLNHWNPELDHVDPA